MTPVNNIQSALLYLNGRVIQFAGQTFCHYAQNAQTNKRKPFPDELPGHLSSRASLANRLTH
jgi:hypothetical protein